jgi:hypothetical protein
MQWEYLTVFLEADAEREADVLLQMRDWKNGIPNYAPEALIPRLNALGEQGWELVHMQPAYVGQKNDILVHDGSSTRVWTSKYFAVFKRPKAG